MLEEKSMNTLFTKLHKISAEWNRQKQETWASKFRVCGQVLCSLLCCWSTLNKMDSNIAIIERKQKRWAHQEVLIAQKHVWQTESRLRGAHAASAPTLEWATLETASQMVVVPQGHRHCGWAITQKASGQRLQLARAQDHGRATKFSTASQMAAAPQGCRHCWWPYLMGSEPRGLGRQGR